MAHEVFISYRRTTGANAARMMQLALTARGYSVFLDYDSLEDGKFNEAIYSAIDSCEVFILMMTEGAFDRCTNPGDWVRLEIQRALEQKKNIVPVAPSDQTWSFPAALPQELSAIRNVHVSKLDMESLFNESVVKIETARFPKELRNRIRCGQSRVGTGSDMAKMFRMFAQAKRERNRIAKLPDAIKTKFADVIRAVEDDLAAAEEAKTCSVDSAMAFVTTAIQKTKELWTMIDNMRNPGEEMMVTLPGGIPMVFCWCPATTSEVWKKISGGTDYFLMGSPETEDGHYDNETLHRVTLTKGFWMGKYPVTEAQWNSVMGESSSSGVGSDHPVAWVSLDEFQEFMRKINLDGKVFVSLPTEAQWEFACRAGTTTPYNFGTVLNGDNANCNGNMPHGTASSGRYLGETSPVGSYLPNAWGIFDMHGNVWEGCSDWFGLYAGDAEDPTGPSQGECHVCRGGGWNSDARGCRSANRYSYRADFSGGGFLGFRLVCSAISHG